MNGADDTPRQPGGLRPRYVRRVSAEHVGQRVSIRRLADDPDRGPHPSDVVGRLLAMDEDVVLVVDRHGRLHAIDATTVVSSRTVPPHPRLPPEPDVGTRDRPLERAAARVLLLDSDDRALLVAHAPDRDRTVWTAPGGGLEPDEEHLAAARRELAEELGVETDVGPLIWRRRVTFSFRTVWIDQDERWFVARTHHLDVGSMPLTDPGALRARWWSVEELHTTTDELAPAAIARHLQDLLDHGPPTSPVDVGR